MKPPKVASIVAVAVVLLSILNSTLKYYTYFLLIVASHSQPDNSVSAENSEEIPHPHDLFVPFLTFIPTSSPVITRPWVLLTASFIEESFLGLTFAAACLFYLGWYLEAKWGAREFMKYVLFVVLATNLTLYFWYAAKNAFLHPTTAPPVVTTTSALVMGCLVAVKQRIAGHYLILYKNLFRIKVTYIPFCFYMFLLLANLVSPSWHIMHCEALVALLVSWVYLRFFKEGAIERQSYLIPFSVNKSQADTPPANQAGLKFDENLPKGDRSNLFALSTFFPGFLGALVNVLGMVVFRVFVHYGLLNSADFTGHDEDILGDAGGSGINSKLFSLSKLKGAENVAMIPLAGDRIKSFFGWSSKNEKNENINMSMEKRRKLAIRQLE